MIKTLLAPFVKNASDTWTKIKPFVFVILATVLVMLYLFSRDKTKPEDVTREQRYLQTIDRLDKEKEDLFKENMNQKDSLVRLQDEYYRHLLSDFQQQISTIQKERDENIDSVDHGDDNFIRRYMSDVEHRQYKRQ
jgi:hypothetical protein